jgi:hypothetical protein
MSESDDNYLRDTEVALMDAIKIVLEIILAAGIARPNAVDQLLAGHSHKYAEKRMPAAVAVMESLRAFVKTFHREAHR